MWVGFVFRWPKPKADAFLLLFKKRQEMREKRKGTGGERRGEGGVDGLSLRRQTTFLFEAL